MLGLSKPKNIHKMRPGVFRFYRVPGLFQDVHLDKEWSIHDSTGHLAGAKLSDIQKYAKEHCKKLGMPPTRVDTVVLLAENYPGVQVTPNKEIHTFYYKEK